MNAKDTIQKETETGHSPLPWFVDANVQNQIVQPLLSKRRRITCPPDKDGIDDAAFIVHAVNCHDELLEACKAALIEFKTEGPSKLQRDYAEKLLAEAIARATGKQE